MKMAIPTIAIALTAGSAVAQERFEVHRQDSFFGACTGGSGTVLINQATGSSSISLNTSNAFSACSWRIRIYEYDSISTLKSLNIQPGSPPEPFLIVLGQSYIANPDAPPNKFDGHWRGMSVFGGSAPETVFYGGITGSLLGPISGVDKIARFECEGDVAHNIFATEGVNGRGAVIRAGSFTSASTIDIGKIESINADYDLRAAIYADLITTSINAGGSQGDGVIEAVKINGPVTFGGTMNRVVSTGTGAEVLGQITASAFGTTGSDLTALDAKVLKANAVITTDLRSPIEIREQWEGTTRRISIGRSLDERTDAAGTLPVGNRMIVLHDANTSDGQVTTPLTNQIIINANNNTPTQDLNGDGLVTTADFWLGDVSIDFPGQANLGVDRFAPAMDEVLIGPDQPAPHAAPYYKALSHTFGGGAVGLAPFNFHQFAGPAPASRADLDCNPWHTEFIVVGDCEEVTSLNAAVIDHYGPVYADGSGPHYRIEFRPAFTAPGNPTWYDVSAQFEVDTAATATSSTSTNRAVRIVPVPTNSNGFEAAGTFRFRPLDGKIKCAGVTGNPDVAYDSGIVSGDFGNTTSGTQHHWYQFRVGLSPCPGGSPLFENDRVNPSDIAAWIDEPFEVNMDGQICQQDLADLLAAYDAQ